MRAVAPCEDLPDAPDVGRRGSGYGSEDRLRRHLDGDPSALAKHEAELPFTLIADRNECCIGVLGVERGPSSVLSPRAQRGDSSVRPPRWEDAAPCAVRSGQSSPPEGRLGLPAAFLIAPDGR